MENINKNNKAEERAVTRSQSQLKDKVFPFTEHVHENDKRRAAGT